MVLATSGGGDEMIEGVDGISSASVMDEAQADADNLIARLDRVLARACPGQPFIALSISLMPPRC